MTIKGFINAAKIFIKTKEGKGTTLDKYLKKISEDVYSTEEVKTNKIWKDGKPIYAKTFTFSNMEVKNGTTYNHGIDNIDTPLFNTGIFTNNDVVFTYPLFSRAGAVLEIVFSKTFIEWIGNDVWIAQPNRTHYITLEYTKTTDNPIE